MIHLVQRPAQTPRPPAHPLRAGGFSFAEMLMALSVCAMIGGGVLAMMAGTLEATDAQNDTRDDIVRQAVLTERLGTHLRAAARVLSLDTATLVLWQGDANQDGQANLSELFILSYRESDDELWCYEAPASLNPADDAAFDPAVDPLPGLVPLLGGVTLPGFALAQGVYAYQAGTVGGTAARPELIWIELTLIGQQDRAGVAVRAAIRTDDPLD